MPFKSSNSYPEYRHKHTDLALKRKEAHNARIRAKRELLEKHKSSGTLNKAIISQIYKK